MTDNKVLQYYYEWRHHLQILATHLEKSGLAVYLWEFPSSPKNSIVLLPDIPDERTKGRYTLAGQVHLRQALNDRRPQTPLLNSLNHHPFTELFRYSIQLQELSKNISEYRLLITPQGINYLETQALLVAQFNFLEQ